MNELTRHFREQSAQPLSTQITSDGILVTDDGGPTSDGQVVPLRVPRHSQSLSIQRRAVTPASHRSAEAIRDGILFTSGRLDETRFGPGVRPNGLRYYRESEAARAGVLFPDGHTLVPTMIREQEIALTTPFLAIGTHAEIAAHFRACRERWGISYFSVRDVESFAPVIALVRS